MSRFPKNLLSIKDTSKFRDYCLNPLGIKIQRTSHFQKEQPVYKFVNFGLKIHRTDKPLESNQFIVKIYNNRENISKPEIRQYLQKLYGLDVQKVNTVNIMGKMVRNHKGLKHLRERDFKKAYITLDSDVDQSFQRVERI